MAAEEQQDQRKQILTLGALGILLVGVLYWFVFRGNPDTAAIVAADEMAGAPGPAGAANVQVASAAPVATAAPNVGTVFVEADFEITQLIQDIREVDFIYADVHEARDPMNPLVGSGVVFSKLAIESGERELDIDDVIYLAESKIVDGIIWDVKNPLAVIDDEVVKVGYRLHEMIYVKAIGHDYVVLSVDVDNEQIEIVRELKEQ